MASNLPAVRAQESLAIPDDELQRMLDQATWFIKTGLLPEAIDTPQKAIIVMQQGRELGLAGQTALQNIFPIKGNAMLSAKLTLALLKRARYRVIPMEVTPDLATYKFISPQGDEFPYTVTWKEAQEANWHMAWSTKKNTWVEKPAWKGAAGRRIMLANRCITQAAKMFASDALLYPPVEEDGSLLVYDPEDAEYMTAEEQAHEQALRDRDQARVVSKGRPNLFKSTGNAQAPTEAAVDESEGEPSPVLLPDMPEQEEPHWIDNEPVRNRFWHEALHVMALSKAQVYEGLELSKEDGRGLHQYRGTKDEAVAQLKRWVAEQQAKPKTKAAQAGLPGVGK